MAATRLYHVTDGQSDHLVWARTPAQAIRHVARDQYTANVAEQAKLVELIRAGVPEENAVEPEAADTADDTEARDEETGAGEEDFAEDIAPEPPADTAGHASGRGRQEPHQFPGREGERLPVGP